MKKRIFITGGSGFIGSALTEKLLAKGHAVASYDAELNFIDNEAYFRRSLELRQKHHKLKGRKLYKGDIREVDRLKKAVTEYKPDVIVHLAGLPMARIPEKYAYDMLTINMTGTLNVLDVFEKSGADRFVYTSSSMAYGHFKQTPQTENFILDPINSYGACKAAGEYFVKLSKKDWVIVRPTSVYGFSDCANRVTQLLLDAANTGKSAWVVDGETLDFSYVDDVAEGFLKCTLLPQAVGHTFNISRGEARGATEFAEEIKKHFPKFIYEVRKPSVQQVWRGPLDITHARNILKFEPKYGISEGIAETIQLMKKYKFYNFD